MNIVWDENKNTLLKQTRNVSFEDAADIIVNHAEIARIKNPVHEGQVYFVVRLHDYIHLVPAVIRDDGEIALKTIFPSRKYNKLYGGNDE
jgi:uncharacterized DUF497 family protein